MGTARAFVAGSGFWPACNASVSGWSLDWSTSAMGISCRVRLAWIGWLRPGRDGFGGYPRAVPEKQKTADPPRIHGPGTGLRSRYLLIRMCVTSDPILRTAGPPGHTHFPGPAGVLHDANGARRAADRQSHSSM